MRSVAASNTPVVVAPSIAPTAPEGIDPIFRAIEAHHQATMAFLRAVNVESRLAPGAPKFKQASAVTNRMWDAFERASEGLVAKPPTSLPGAQALLTYVCRFNRGEFKAGKRNCTGPEMWPVDLHFLDEKLLTVVGKVMTDVANPDAACAAPVNQRV